VLVQTDNGLECTVIITDLPPNSLIRVMVRDRTSPALRGDGVAFSEVDNSTTIPVATSGTAVVGDTARVTDNFAMLLGQCSLDVFPVNTTATASSVAATTAASATSAAATATFAAAQTATSVAQTSTSVAQAATSAAQTAVATGTVPATVDLTATPSPSATPNLTATVPATVDAGATQTAVAGIAETAAAQTATALAGTVPVATAVTATATAPTVTGDVEIAKLYCVNTDLAGKVEFEVLGPEFPFDGTDITGQAGVGRPDTCTPGAAEFAIFPFGEKDADPILVSVDGDGLIVLNGIIPVTGDEPHKLVELTTDDANETTFEVEAGAVTQIIVINYVGEGTAPTATTGAGTGATATAVSGGGSAAAATTATTGGTTALPNTGAGAGQRGAELGLLAIAGLGAAAVSVRRR